MRFTAISYATGEHYVRCQERLNLALQAQEFDDIRSFGPNDIDPAFIAQHHDVMSAPKILKRNGQLVTVESGSCLWKPYLILKTLLDVNNGDIVLYMDVEDIIYGPSSLKRYLIEYASTNRGFVGVEHPTLNKDWIRRDTFVLMGHDIPDYWDAHIIEAGFIAFEKNLLSIQFLGAWLAYGSDLRIIGNPANQFGENLSGFVEHRYDQAIYSLLVKRYGYSAEPIWQGPARYGLVHKFNEPLSTTSG